MRCRSLRTRPKSHSISTSSRGHHDNSEGVNKETQNAVLYDLNQNEIVSLQPLKAKISLSSELPQGTPFVNDPPNKRSSRVQLRPQNLKRKCLKSRSCTMQGPINYAENKMNGRGVKRNKNCDNSAKRLKQQEFLTSDCGEVIHSNGIAQESVLDKGNLVPIEKDSFIKMTPQTNNDDPYHNDFHNSQKLNFMHALEKNQKQIDGLSLQHQGFHGAPIPEDKKEQQLSSFANKIEKTSNCFGLSLKQNLPKGKQDGQLSPGDVKFNIFSDAAVESNFKNNSEKIDVKMVNASINGVDTDVIDHKNGISFENCDWDVNMPSTLHCFPAVTNNADFHVAEIDAPEKLSSSERLIGTCSSAINSEIICNNISEHHSPLTINSSDERNKEMDQSPALSPSARMSRVCIRLGKSSVNKTRQSLNGQFSATDSSRGIDLQKDNESVEISHKENNSDKFKKDRNVKVKEIRALLESGSGSNGAHTLYLRQPFRTRLRSAKRLMRHKNNIYPKTKETANRVLSANKKKLTKKVKSSTVIESQLKITISPTITDNSPLQSKITKAIPKAQKMLPIKKTAAAKNVPENTKNVKTVVKKSSKSMIKPAALEASKKKVVKKNSIPSKKTSKLELGKDTSKNPILKNNSMKKKMRTKIVPQNKTPTKNLSAKHSCATAKKLLKNATKNQAKINMNRPVVKIKKATNQEAKKGPNHLPKKSPNHLPKQFGFKNGGKLPLSKSAGTLQNNKIKKSIGDQSNNFKSINYRATTKNSIHWAMKTNLASQVRDSKSNTSNSLTLKSNSLLNYKQKNKLQKNQKNVEVVASLPDENLQNFSTAEDFASHNVMEHQNTAPKAKKTITAPLCFSKSISKHAHMKKKKKYYKGGRYRLDISRSSKKRKLTSTEKSSNIVMIVDPSANESIDPDTVANESKDVDTLAHESKDADTPAHESTDVNMATNEDVGFATNQDVDTAANENISSIGTAQLSDSNNFSASDSAEGAAKIEVEDSQKVGDKSVITLRPRRLVAKKSFTNVTTSHPISDKKTASSRKSAQGFPDTDNAEDVVLLDIYELLMSKTSGASTEMYAKKSGTVNKASSSLKVTCDKSKELEIVGYAMKKPSAKKSISDKLSPKESLWNLRPSDVFYYSQLKSGDIAKVAGVLANGANPNHKFKNYGNNSALHVASSMGELSIVQLLVKSGAQVESLNDELKTPLMMAIEKISIPVIQYLLKSGASIHTRDDIGVTAFHLAAKVGNLAVMEVLYETGGVNLDSQDEGGWTALVWACEHGNFPIVNRLLGLGADPNLRDKEKNIALHWSALAGDVDSLTAILERGSNVNAANKYKDTPLHIASRGSHYECVQQLLSRGADTSLRNMQNLIPLLCCSDYSSETSKCLQEREFENFASTTAKSRFISISDVSRGKERLPIEVVNDVDEVQFVHDFCYTTTLCESPNIHINRIVKSMKSCRCTGVCTRSNCNCSMLSIRLWYDENQCLVRDFDMTNPAVIFECSKLCSCNQNCTNRVVQRGIKCHVQLCRYAGKGWGLRTLKDIKRGAFICEYIGEVITDLEACKRQDDSYIMNLESEEDSAYCIDAKLYGNISRFINHSCSPNLVALKVFTDHQDLSFPRIAFFATRAIKAKEELCFDYGDSFWNVKSNYFLCMCGSSSCKYSRKTVTSTFSKYHGKLKKLPYPRCGS